jgi:hypothetical protein
VEAEVPLTVSVLVVGEVLVIDPLAIPPSERVDTVALFPFRLSRPVPVTVRVVAEGSALAPPRASVPPLTVEAPV